MSSEIWNAFWFLMNLNSRKCSKATDLSGEELVIRVGGNTYTHLRKQFLYVCLCFIKKRK